jgi:hypothetical protein
MKMKLIFLLLLLIQSLLAQSQPEAEREESEGMDGRHRLTIGLGHTYLAQAKIDGRSSWVPEASWSVDYDYWLSDRWGLGVQNEWILETFVVDDGGSRQIERENPWAIVPVALFKVSEHWTFLGGVGVELSGSESITMTKLGVERGLHLPKNWEVGIVGVWGGKWGFYNSWGLALTLSKLSK